MMQSKEDYAWAIKEAAGTFSGKNHPEWKNIDSIVKWVNQERKRAERY